MRLLTMLVIGIGGIMVLFTDAPTAADKHDLDALQGAWVMTQGEEDGHEIPEEVRKTARLMFTGDHHIVHVGKMTTEGKQVLDASAHPKTIDSTDVIGEFKGQVLLGIYELKGDEFKVCFGAHGGPRPTEFSAKAGSGQFVHAWKRAKDTTGHAAE